MAETPCPGAKAAGLRSDRVDLVAAADRQIDARATDSTPGIARRLSRARSKKSTFGAAPLLRSRQDVRAASRCRSESRDPRARVATKLFTSSPAPASSTTANATLRDDEGAAHPASVRPPLRPAVFSESTNPCATRRSPARGRTRRREDRQSGERQHARVTRMSPDRGNSFG